jgi:hypothetical protein
MEHLPIVKELINTSEVLEKEYTEKVKVGMSRDEVFEAVEEIENFPFEELEHVINNIFTWDKPLEEGSRNTLKNEYFSILKRDLLEAIKNQILVEEYSY